MENALLVALYDSRWDKISYYQSNVIPRIGDLVDISGRTFRVLAVKHKVVTHDHTPMGYLEMIQLQVAPVYHTEVSIGE